MKIHLHLLRPPLPPSSEMARASRPVENEVSHGILYPATGRWFFYFYFFLSLALPENAPESEAEV